MEERRRNRRLELDGKLIAKRLDGGQQEEYSIEVVDVSKTGIGFQCETPLQIGTVYETMLTLWTKDTINAFIEIVRIEKISDTFLYGGIFIGMPNVELQRIMVYETMRDMEEMEENKDK